MRKIAPLLIILILLFSLSAEEIVQSNSIGQDRGRFAQDGEYTLGIQGGESTLYNGRKAVWRETITSFEDGFERSTYHFEDGSTTIQRYEQNRLVSEETGDEVRYYYYDDKGVLEKTMVLVQEKISEMEIYTYDANTKALNSVLTITKDGSSISYFGDPAVQPWFSYTKDKTFTKVRQISENIQIQEVWEGDVLNKAVEVEIHEEGGIRLTTREKGMEASDLYDDEGLLVLRVSSSLTTEYRYNEDRSLTESIETDTSGHVRIIRYEEGQEVSESLYQGDILEKEIFYPGDSGKVETLYDNGQPYCDITYALDGKRVLSIRYR